MNLSRVACKYVDIELTATLSNGENAPLAGVDVTVVRAGDSPDEATTWVATQYANGRATFMLAGPDAINPPPAAVLVTEPGGDVWCRVVDQPETDAAMIDRVTLI